MRRILITGGTGFVGSHLISFLQPSEVKLVVISSSGAVVQHPGVDYCKVDIRDADDVSAVIRAARPDQIYHLAAVSSVADCWNNPRLAFDVNVAGSCNVFEAAMHLPSPPRILNVSTSQVYMRSGNALSETSRLGPDNPYAATKAMAELLAVQYRKSSSGGVITARAFNHTGPGQLPGFVMASVAKQLAEVEAGLRPPVLKVGDLNVKRDFTDVRDTVVAYRELLDKGETGEIYNVCSGRAVLLADVVRELQKHCRATVTIEIDPARVRPSEVPQVHGNPGKIRRATGWSATIPLESTLQSLLAYWRAKVTRDSAEPNDIATRMPRG
ncbi:MAG: GDP-mannose 4,6-dehydratase [Terriglobales bacterium]